MEERVKKPVSKVRIAAQIILYLLGFIILSAYICTYFAESAYIFELLSNFLLQIMVAAFAIGILGACLKNRPIAAIMITLAVICFVQSRLPFEAPWRLTPPGGEASLTIATYNQRIGNQQFNDMAQWLNAPENDIDVIVIIEAITNTKTLAHRVREKYPHTIFKHTVMPNKRPISYFILSKYEILDHERIELNKKPYHNFVARFKIMPDGAREPYTIYAAHTHSPINQEYIQFRNDEMVKMAELIAQDISSNIIALGDFNITPYSQHFKGFKQISGLNFQSYGVFLNPTWPSNFSVPFLRIPIDHMFYSDNLVQQNKYVGPSVNSDHHALIAQYSEKK